MTFVAVATPPAKSVEELDALIQQLPSAPEGMIARYVGTSGSELRIVSVWDSEEDANDFFANHLAPALAKTYGPETVPRQLDRINVVREYTRQLVS